MMMLRRKALLIVLVFAPLSVLLVSAAVAGTRPTQAQGDPAALTALLMQLRAQGISLTIEFAKPLIPGEPVWTLPDDETGRDIARAGTDYVCFSEPWNSTRKILCTPTSNILTMNYTE